MKCSFVLPPIEPYSPRGLALSTIVLHTARELVRGGHTVDVVTAGDPEGLYDEPDVIELALDDQTPWRRIRRRLGRAVGDRWSEQKIWHRRVAEALASRPAPDAVIAMNDLQIHLELRDRFPDVVLATWLQNEPDRSPRDLLALTTADRLLCCSEYIRSVVVGAGARAVDARVVNNCIDVDAFVPEARSGAHDGPLRLLFVGRLDPNKGPDAVVAAVAELPGSVPVTVTMAGPATSYSLAGSAYDEWLAQLLADLARVGGRYVGRVERPDLPALYRAHDVSFVLSRSEEPFGMVALEAMGCGNVVVTSGRGGLREATGGFGVYVDPDDIVALSAVIAELAADRSRFEAQRLAGAQWASSRSWQHASAALLSAVSR